MSTDKAQELLDRLHERVSTLVSGEDWKAALDFQARLHKYSWNNALLIALQCPEATMVGGMKSLWNKVGRHVNKGERAIWVLAPMTKRVEDKETGEVRYRPTGWYKAVPVFDVSQTDGDPLPTDVIRANELEGDAPAEYYANLKAQVASAGYTVIFDGDDLLPRDAKGVTIPATKTVVVKAMSPLARTKTLVHELTHVLLHVDRDERDGEPFTYATHRGMAEVEAESTAYVVCAALGLPTDDYSFPYVGGWSGGDMDLVKKTGERVAKTARLILAAFEKEAVAA